ncbi:DUF2721 domain-containing protein [Oceanicoccus sagamiensis]|uniref:DUF2721 domain-containing protein n=1 Tax=Oceanicoccus sagamiensis TaxID=716816 RepID=UPI000A26A0D4|nr:DUF2721 domain-containing protein [Oceanicoccus sagamiensis]
METITIDILGNIGQTVQLAVAPVFLLTGIAAFLGVLSNRLGRITDRARILERRLATTTGEQNEFLQNELASLWRRIGMINKAIRLCTISALLICLVVVTLFLGGLLHASLSLVIAFLFISAMLALIMALIYFLREVTRATQSMQMGMEIAVDDILKE